jgi:phage gpG-like protein
MIAATMTNADEGADRLAALTAAAEAALEAVSADLADRLLAIAQRNLSGDVLNARSGRLRDSLAANVDLAGPLTATVTADTPYAAFQEYGFQGAESVRAYLRQQSQVFGRTIRPVQVAVKAHDRHVDYPAHSYLRSALAELAPDIRAAVASALAGALSSGGFGP